MHGEREAGIAVEGGHEVVRGEPVAPPPPPPGGLPLDATPLDPAVS